jgi:DNA-binding GntR family transcriptional regulator
VSRPRETPEYAGAVRRMIRAHGRRVAAADPEDLAELVAMREVLEAAIAEAVAGQKADYSWAMVARGLGTTRQAAQMRYGQPVDSRARRPA